MGEGNSAPSGARFAPRGKSGGEKWGGPGRRR